MLDVLTIEFYLLSKPVTPIEDGADTLCSISTKDICDIFFIESANKTLNRNKEQHSDKLSKWHPWQFRCGAKIVKILLTQKLFLFLPKIV